MLKYLGVSRSGYRAFLLHKPSASQQRKHAIKEKIKDIYDDSIVRQMVECIKVYHDGRLQIILGGGYELEEYLEK